MDSWEDFLVEEPGKATEVELPLGKPQKPKKKFDDEEDEVEEEEPQTNGVQNSSADSTKPKLTKADRVQQRIQERNIEKAIQASEEAAKSNNAAKSSKEDMRQAEIDSDLANAMDLFDIVDQNTASGNRARQAEQQRELKTKADFAAFQAEILRKVKHSQNSTEYSDFVQELIPLMLTSLNASSVKSIQKSVNKVVAQKEQQEKAQSKRGAPAAPAKKAPVATPSTTAAKKSAKPTVNTNSKRGAANDAVYEDYVEDEYDDYADDFDDFM
ncbi:translation initiation factor eIF3j [Schizosaccharomyces octosporus yFS286]|uniref:Eukaryotic translation initiation factor 3 30 kDa subunit n=1 Tax=Schizosaccharomyces octosporus (strain yFS286) TaxID=483514 RepID=S9RLJ5_SCHOY|nr:translation initiation factor eIF3j [Schizosaccharomyces octosporus yFS286]EPX74844.1 translation initiation factor eIF3j [Schizosaccharomyces octosporus yFS286]